MYNRQWNAWESDSYDDALLLWCREPFNRENPQALYILADTALGKAGKGQETADAVYHMEKAANLGLAQAALAMGQMFQYGWAVHRSWKMAGTWYEKAAALGSTEAADHLARLRKARRRRILAGCAGALGAAVLVVTLYLFYPKAPPEGVLVHEDTELITPVTFEEFSQALGDLIGQYDDELVVSGQRSTNRLLLKFEGQGIDLSSFPAATVIADEENYLVIQFETEEEAQACLDALRRMDGILFADMDSYQNTPDSSTADTASQNVPYQSPYSGIVYYTWGVEYLGMDQLAAWLMEQPTTPVTVAVVDTGVEPCQENAHRILEGFDAFFPTTGNGWTDQDGHGTHVAGTIIDCTWNLDVSILPVRVFENSTTADSYILQGLRYAMDMGVDVINMSLGGVCDATAPGEQCGSPFDYILQEAFDQGITVVVSAGNGDENANPIDTCGYCPAHNESCIVVAACDDSGNLGYFSNYGESVDVTAPGVNVISYFPGGTFQALDGTSMAAPHISALAAMLKLYLPDKTPAQIEKYITDYCVDMGDSLRYGEGIPWAAYFAGE